MAFCLKGLRVTLGKVASDIMFPEKYTAVHPLDRSWSQKHCFSKIKPEVLTLGVIFIRATGNPATRPRTEIRESLWCQLCRQQWPRRLSKWQPQMPHVTTKLASYRLLVLSAGTSIVRHDIVFPWWILPGCGHDNPFAWLQSTWAQRSKVPVVCRSSIA